MIEEELNFFHKSIATHSPSATCSSPTTILWRRATTSRLASRLERPNIDTDRAVTAATDDPENYNLLTLLCT
jgi:hypothetical protein